MAGETRRGDDIFVADFAGLDQTPLGPAAIRSGSVWLERFAAGGAGRKLLFAKGGGTALRGYTVAVPCHSKKADEEVRLRRSAGAATTG
jgi:hypothetical protein